MKFSQLAVLAWTGLVCILISGCGDVFRPVATPLPQPSPDPQTFRLATFTSCVYSSATNDCSTTGAAGAAADVNVSGDSLVGVSTVGRSPIFALVEAARVATADRDTNTVTTYNRLNISGVVSISPTSTAGLPAGASPTSLANANGSLYVTESGRNVVGVLGGFPVALTTEIAVGINPTSLTVLPNSRKVYALNQGDGTVSVISTTNNQVLATVSVGSNPVWAVASADSSRVYVVNRGSASVTVIDASSDAVVATIPVGTAPNYAAFDAKNQRVLVTNTGSGTLSVINADSTSPTFKNVTTVAVGTNPSSVTALADGTRIYVANSGSNSVTVISSLSLAVSKTISLVSTVTVADQTPTPVWVASDQQSLKVLTANRNSSNISIINTSTDSELADSTGKPIRVAAPNVDPACTGSSCARLNPVFIAVGPG